MLRLSLCLALLTSPALAGNRCPDGSPIRPGNYCPGDINIVFPTVAGCTNPKDPKTGKYSMDCSKAKMVGGTSRQKARGTFTMDRGGNVTYTPD
jgi:hypothetical protein